MDVIALTCTTILDIQVMLLQNTRTEEHSFYSDFSMPCVKLDICLQGISKSRES